MCLAVADEFAYMHPITTAVQKLYGKGFLLGTR